MALRMTQNKKHPRRGNILEIGMEVPADLEEEWAGKPFVTDEAEPAEGKAVKEAPKDKAVKAAPKDK